MSVQWRQLRHLEINKLLHMYIDSDHVSNKWTRRSRTEMSFINWCLERPSITETSAFGTDFDLMKVWVGILCAIWYKFIIMCITICGHTYVYGKNMLVINNTSMTELTLKKKSNAITYHAMNEFMIVNKSLTGHMR